MLSTKKILSVGVGIASMAGVMAMSTAPVAAAEGTIEVVTHAGAGGGTDVNSRMMMIRTRRHLKQDMVVVNKRGGGGAAAMQYFKSRPADGNTVLTFTVGHAITMAKGKTDLTVEDMAPIARGTNDPQILMVNCKTSPYKTPEEFVAGMKNGDAMKFGGTSSGTIDHLTVFLWAKRLGVDMPTYIPFGGGGELATQVVAGAVETRLGVHLNCTCNSVRCICPTGHPLHRAYPPHCCQSPFNGSHIIMGKLCTKLGRGEALALGVGPATDTCFLQQSNNFVRTSGSSVHNHDPKAACSPCSVLISATFP